MWTRASRRALGFIEANGGRLYVWGEDAGAAWAVVRCSTDRPIGPRFESVVTDDEFELFVAEDIGPAVIAVTLTWPGRQLRVEAMDEHGGDG